MTRTPPVPLKATDQHPINRALGFLPRTDSPERKVYRRLINRWMVLPTQEHRDFVSAVIGARGDWEGAMYAAGLAKVSDPENQTRRNGRRLAANPDVRMCLEDAALLIGRPSAPEVDLMLSGIMRAAHDASERLAALKLLEERDPTMKPHKGVDAARRIAENLHAIVQLARDLDVADSPTAALARTNGFDGASSKAQREAGYPGWRVPDDKTTPAEVRQQYIDGLSGKNRDSDGGPADHADPAADDPG